MDPAREEPELKQGVGAVEIVLTVFVIILLIGTGVYYYLVKEGAVGHAALQTPQAVATQLEKFFTRFSMSQYVGDGAKLCVIVPLTNGLEASFALRKEQGIMKIMQSDKWGCEGQGEDFILRYVSAAAFSKHMADPSCKGFAEGGRGAAFWWLPAALWPAGDFPKCDVQFREKYCPALAYCMEPSLLPMFSCCNEGMTPFATQRMNEARKLGETKGDRLREAPVFT